MAEIGAMSSVETLLRLLERQRALVEQLDVLSGRQGGLIDGGESDALLELLGQRQQIMDQFIAGQDSLAQLAEATRRDAGGADAAARARIGALVDEISERLAEVMARDEEDRARLEANRDGVGEALAGLSTARQAQRAYIKNKAVGNRFADRQG